VARSSLFLLLFLLLWVESAHARQINFASRRGFGLSVSAGLTNNPFVNYIPEPLTYSSAYSTIYTMGFFLDYSNFIIEPGVVWLNHSKASGAGTGYTESATAYTVAPQIRIRLVPAYFNGHKGRFYFGASIGTGQTYIKNSRLLTAGGGFSERVKGSSALLMMFAGVEMFAVQNYAIGLDLGYRNYFTDQLTYLTANDTSGTATTVGADKNIAGRKAFLVSRGFYSQLNFYLHF
jgi:hypothetical protein